MAEREDSSANRFSRLRDGVSSIGRGSDGSFARWLMIGGGALMGIGIAAIVLGWAGASHTPYVFEQMPYVISGGLLGAALAVIGGLLYFAYWMTRSLEEARAASDRTVDALQRIEELLGARTVTATNGNGAPSAIATTARVPFVKTGRGSMFHRPDCSMVAGKGELVGVGSSGDGFQPCGVCDPLALV